MDKKYTIITYGCQMNQHDSEKIAYLLESLGYSKVETVEESDFIIYNTCLVRENAELRVYGQLGSLKGLKRKKPDMIIAVCGCMMQTGGARSTIISNYKHVDIIFGTKNISRLPSLISRHRSTGEVVVDIEEEDIIDDETPINRNHPFIAYVNIMTGCNNYCSFCIVPYARGKELSRTPENIIKEIKDLAEKGYKEIILLGQNVNSYGKTLRPRVSFPELLKMINEIDGIERIRFMTSHPKDCSDELIDAIATLPKVCKNIHLPFQSGSNSILKQMRRVYTKEHYLNLIKKLKERISDITLSTDIIVGFPGETEEDFQGTLHIVEEVEFEQGFTFLYSIRKGTKAAEMENQIPHDIKQERFQRLVDKMYEIFYKKNEQDLGKTFKVLVERTSKNNDEVLTGRTEGYKLVHFRGEESLIGKMVNVKITGHNSFALDGVIV